ncbi:hypothetical protein H0H87_002933, partial [Tephrocybe sp. NHM501043]
MKKLAKKVGQKLLPKSRSVSPAPSENVQVTSGSSPATRASAPLPAVASGALSPVPTSGGVPVISAIAITTQGNLPPAVDIPSITVDHTESGSMLTPGLAPGNTRPLLIPANTTALATDLLQVPGSPGAKGSLTDDEAAVSSVAHATELVSTGDTSQLVGDTSASARDSTARNTKMKSGLLTAWNGTQLLLNRAAGLLDGTPLKTPVAAVNVLIKLGSPRSLRKEQDIADNNDALKEIMSSTGERLELVAAALAKEGDAVSHEMIEQFAATLIKKILELHLMSTKATWKKIIESDDDKKKISHVFKEIDEQTKNFY